MMTLPADVLEQFKRWGSIGGKSSSRLAKSIASKRGWIKRRQKHGKPGQSFPNGWLSKRKNGIINPSNIEQSPENKSAL